jgi:hypothetical protein
MRRREFPSGGQQSCKACQHQVEPNPAEQAERYGAEMPVTEWHERLVCSQCGSREIDMVVNRDRAAVASYWPKKSPGLIGWASLFVLSVCILPFYSI